MENRYRLELIGITFNQIESGVYAVILQQAGTKRRIPIIIGYPEAQAIECQLQGIAPPRPLTHDTMVRTLASFGIVLQEVFIKRLPNGVFTADMIFSDGKTTVTIDGRSSDAIALAIRVGAPIYTSETVLKEAGFEMGKRNTPQGKDNKKGNTVITNIADKKDFSTLSDQQLTDAMKEAVACENYEEAAKIKNEIERRNSQDIKDEEQKEKN